MRVGPEWTRFPLGRRDPCNYGAVPWYATVILDGMTYRVGPKGQVVLPKALRDELGIRPGDEVDVDKQGDGLLVRRARTGSRLFRRLADADLDLLGDLRTERQSEAARDAER